MKHELGDSKAALAAAAEAAQVRPMAVVERGVYRGPHFYSRTPMVRIRLDLGTLEDFPTDRLPGFADRILAALPGLADHGCSCRTAGGFVRRLREGTWLGHVAEHVALELQKQAGHTLTRGKTRSVRGEPGVYDVMFAYEQEEVGLAAGGYALMLIDSLLPVGLHGVTGAERLAPPLPGPFGLDEALAELRRLVRAGAFGPSTQSLVDEARRRDIPVMRLNRHSLIQLGHGARQKRIRASVTGSTSLIGAEAAGDKSLTKSLLEEIGLPTARGEVARTAEEATAAARRIGFPVVVKPLAGNHGRGVTTGVADEAAVHAAFEAARSHSRAVLVERMLMGRDHRFLVVAGKVEAVAERTPAAVTGDGSRTIAELVEAENADPRRGNGHEKVMTRISIDDAVLARLARLGLSLQSVPAAGQVVELRDTANLSTGGKAIDRTDSCHPDNIAIAEQAAAVIGLDVAGIDIILPDAARSMLETGGGIVEVNAAPGLRMHLAPSQGHPRAVARPILRSLFPEGEDGRIPIFAITGTNGKSTTGRMLAAILKTRGLCVGLTNTSGVYVDGRRMVAADASGPKSARMLLRNPKVEAAVLEVARGGILREGLGFDRADVGAVLNVTADHLGLKGVDTLERLASVKSVVVESVKRRGFSVLNADDPLTLGMARHATGRLALFSIQGAESEPVRAHIEAGGLAATYERGLSGGDIVIHSEGERLRIMGVAEIPATLGGAARFNIENALAAALMAFAQFGDIEAIRAGLSGFNSDFAQNPGRMNIYEGHPFRVILDYAHNPAALTKMGELVLALRPAEGRTIGMVSIPGDRRDEDIREMGRIAAGMFDEIVFRERPDGRGRREGEVVALLGEGARQAGAPAHRVHQVIAEPDAAQKCLELAAPGDLVVLMPTKVEAVWEQMVAFRPGLASEGVIAIEPAHG